ncbi:Origin of replication complex subunit 1A [Porphyridium purpureum]|uniref:Origin recognition complex subunit 1 n=1 Tax=Porphyridium purpureum TaxID=35688 RepID=A0A5J4YTS4_PORPP|nr:Origin of replication complex subunit 1A [Porphyridium purpureum]|eukprot:POR7691..scf229_5
MAAARRAAVTSNDVVADRFFELDARCLRVFSDASSEDAEFIVEPGDFVRITACANAGPEPFVAQVFRFEPRGERMHVRYAFRADECRHVPPFATAHCELLLSDHLDILDVSTVKDKVHVVSYQRYLAEKQTTPANEPLFFIRRAYSQFDGVFVDLDDAQAQIDGFHILTDAGATHAEPWREGAGDVNISDWESDGDVPSEEQQDDDDEEFDVDQMQRQERRQASRRGARGPRAASMRLSNQFVLPNTPAPNHQKHRVLQCREQEKERLREFVRGAIGVVGKKSATTNNIPPSPCLYISGVPGTGKTATLHEVLREFESQRTSGACNAFRVVEINGMTIPRPEHAYVMIYQTLLGANHSSRSAAIDVSAAFAKETLSKHFARSAKRAPAAQRTRCDSIIVVLDEMDALVARREDLLYNVVNWTIQPHSHMSVIGIANTMDLPERFLTRIGSRFGLARLTYPPYTKDQLTLILAQEVAQICARLLSASGLPDHSSLVFDSASIQLCAGKVAVISGDARRAFEMCRAAARRAVDEWFESESAAPTQALEPRRKRPKRGAVQKADEQDRQRTVEIRVMPRHVNEAAEAAAHAGQFAILQSLSQLQQLTLCAAASLQLKEGQFSGGVTLQSLEHKCRQIASRTFLPALTGVKAAEASTASATGLHHSENAHEKVERAEIYEAIATLLAMRILLLDNSKHYHYHHRGTSENAASAESRVSLNVQFDDVLFALGMSNPLALWLSSLVTVRQS